MAEKTGISWTDSTLNLAVGCTKVSEECKNCYMYRDMNRYKQFDPYKVTLTKAGKDKSVMRNLIKKAGEKIFVNSWSDTFHKDISDATLYNWFQVFQEFPKKQFQILTKRPERMSQFALNFNGHSYPKNCWMGTSIGTKESLIRLVPLQFTSAYIKFVSFEPLLEDLGQINLQNVDWAIIGGESDFKNPRPMKPEWAENIVKQAREQNVSVFFKQMGGLGGGGAGGDLLNERKIQEFPNYGVF
jgi:protein gp37